TVEAVSNTNPDGTFKMIVPVLISLPDTSSRIGPVKVVHVPPVLFAEIAAPPVAAVTLTPATSSVVHKVANAKKRKGTRNDVFKLSLLPGQPPAIHGLRK